MISTNNNPLFSLTNYSVPLTTNSANNAFEESFEQSKASCHDRIFNFLIQKGIIDASSSLCLSSKNLVLPGLAKEQLDRLNELLTTPFQVKSKNSDLFSISICLNDLFRYLNLNAIDPAERSIEVVGGSVFWILGVEYMIQICNLLNIPEEFITDELLSEFKVKAADVDIRMWGVKDPEFEKLRVCYFLASYLPETFNHYTLSEKALLIRDHGFTNFFTPSPEFTSDRLGMVSFGERQSFSVDLLFLGSLKRKNLFKHDAVKIVLPNLNVSSDSPSIQSNSKSILESMILKLTKILSADKLEEIDLPGSTKLFMHLTKGWRYTSESLEKILLDNFLKSGKYYLLKKLVDNHFPTEKFAAEALCFNVYSLMPGAKDILFKISEELLPRNSKTKEIEDSPLLLFQAAMSELSLINFELLIAFFQIFGSIGSHAASSRLEVIKTKIKGESFLQIKFNTLAKPLYLNIKNDFNKSLTDFKKHIDQFKTTQLEFIFQALSKYFIGTKETLKISEIHTERCFEDVSESSTMAFDLLNVVNAENCFLNQMGFYLLCHAGAVNKNSTYLNHLNFKLPALLTNESSPSVRKNLIYSLVKYWLTTDNKEILWQHSEKIEAFYEAMGKEGAETLKLFCLLFSEFEIPSLSGIIFNSWQKYPELFDLESSCQLIKNIKKHDLYTSLKILKKLSLQKEDSEKLKSCFDLIVEEYAKAKNKLIAERDFSRLSDVAEEIVDNMNPFKKVPKQDEMASYIGFITKLMSIDFERSLKLIKSLEDKQALEKGFSTVLQNASGEDKIKFTIQFNKNNPLDSKSNVTAIQERVELLIKAVSSDFDTVLLKELAEEICKVLAIYFKGKKGSTSKIKDILKPKLGSFLHWLLTDLKKQKTPKDTLLFYFQVVDTLAVEANICLKFVPILMTIFKEILQNASNQPAEIEFIKVQLLKVPARKAVILEELQLYHEIVKLLLEGKKTDTATEFLKKILKKSQPNSEIMNFVLSCFDQYIEKQNASAALSLLGWIEKPFPENPLANDPIRLKKLVLSLNEKQALKKLEILTAKPELFLDDKSFLKVAEQLVLFLLKNQSLLKDKCIDSILKLIKTFRLTEFSIFMSLKDHLKLSKDKKLTETTFLMFQEMGLNFTHLSPFIQPLTLVNSTYVSNFLKYHKEIATKCQSDQKKEIIQDLILGFLNLFKIESPNPLEIHEAILFLENELRVCNLGTLEKQTEIDSKYVRKFTELATDNLDIIFIVWEKLKALALKAKKNNVAEVLQLFTKALSTYKNLEALFEPNIVEFLESIKTKVNPLQMVPYFNHINLDSSQDLLRLNIYYAVAIVKSCPIEKSDRTQGEYLKFKPNLKTLIDICIEKNEFLDLPILVNQVFLEWKEIYYYKGKISSVIFNKRDAITNLKFVIDALDFYVENLESPDECPDFEEENRKNAINFLLALIFIHQEPSIYYKKLMTISKKLFHYIEQKDVHLPRTANPYLDMKYFSTERIPPKKENLLMKQKTYKFFIQLTEALNSKVIEHRHNLTELVMTVTRANISHLSLLLSFPNKNDEIVSAALNYCYTTTFLPIHVYRTSIDAIKLIIRCMNEKGFFTNAATKESLKNSFKLVALAQLPIEWFRFIDNKEKAEMILDVIKKIGSFKGKDSNFLVLEYLGLYRSILDSSRKEKTDPYSKQLNDSLTEVCLDEQRELINQTGTMGLTEDLLLSGGFDDFFRDQLKKQHVQLGGLKVADWEVKKDDLKEEIEDHNSHWILDSEFPEVKQQKLKEPMVEYYHVTTKKDAIDLCKSMFRTDNNNQK